VDYIRVLLVDDDEIVRMALTGALEQSGFVVTCAAGVAEALKLISGPESYDVLLSDLHMPGAGDGLTVVSAMRHANPKAVTLLLSAFPEMTAAVAAILQQADEILVKPIDLGSLIAIIKERIHGGPQDKRRIETVASILERAADGTILEWFARIETNPTLMSISMSREQRCRHLPPLFQELIARLRSGHPIGSMELTSASAAEHGANRCRQGYTASMLVEESRMLQISIFHTLQKNLASIDYSVLLVGVMTIADEIDSQLSQAVTRYTIEALRGPIPSSQPNGAYVS
jgi:DNA-binding response OmpR family regulator